MIIKKFKAPTMTEALVKVRDELGTEAIILSTRSKKKGGVFDFVGSSMVEVTAAIDEKSLVEGSGKLPSAKPISPPEARFYPPKPSVAYKPVKKPGYLRQLDVEVSSIDSRVKNDEILDDIRELKRSIKILADSSLRSDMSGLPPNLATIYTNLQACGMDDKISKRMLHQLLDSLNGADMADSDIINEKAAELLFKGINDVRPISFDGMMPRIITIIGPTGSGKTTTVAKLATDFVLNRGKKVSVVTIDTKRVDGVGQLKAFCRILNIPLHVVYTPSELTSIMDDLKKNDILLVDTPGAGPLDKSLMQEMDEFIGMIKPQEVHLSMSVTTALNEMHRIYENFSILKPNRILFTKLDETDNYGQLLSFAIMSNSPLSYFTFGQNVPGDFSEADPMRLLKKNITGSLENIT